MFFCLCSSDVAEFMNDLLRKWSKSEVFCKFCELVTKLTVVLIRVIKKVLMSARMHFPENLGVKCKSYL